MNSKKIFLVIGIIFLSFSYAKALKRPLIEGLKSVSEIPSEIPHGITAIAFDGEKFWAASYHNKGCYATFNPQNNQWKFFNSEKERQAFGEVTGTWSSTGGMTFINNKLWLASAYGFSFGNIDTETWETKVFKGKYRDDNTASQHYAGMAFDGEHLWVAWHWYKYVMPNSKTQVLLKIEPETGKVLNEFPLPPGTRNAGARGLIFDGENLWDLKDNRLSAIDRSNGNVIIQYRINQIKRAITSAWDGNSMWIIAEGKIWKLPFENTNQ